MAPCLDLERHHARMLGTQMQRRRSALRAPISPHFAHQAPIIFTHHDPPRSERVPNSPLSYGHLMSGRIIRMMRATVRGIPIAGLSWLVRDDAYAFVVGRFR